MIRKDYVGCIYENNSGKFRVNKEIITPIVFEGEREYRKLEIEFLETGYKTIIENTIINKKDGIKDRYKPSIAGVGFIGDINISIRDPRVFPLYRIWANIIDRCYNTKIKHYNYYGAKGVTVDPRWCNFTNFYYDVQKLPGYENKVMYPNLYHLDKDYLQMGKPLNEKIYSPSTCMWISIYDNSILANESYISIYGYRGVVEARGTSWYTVFEGIKVAKFNCIEAAACYYNYLSLERIKYSHHMVCILNEINMIPYNELMSNKYLEKIMVENVFNNKSN